jgi:demethylmenaquinone methyltransferase / 2-methoxy-6-polyprenyl-1,4-benzoquinol methylase
MTEPRPGSGAMFDGIAARYDLLNRLASFGLDRSWRRRAVRALALRPGARVIDVATGTADVAIAITRAQPDLQVIGVDPSPGMLAVGREKIEALGLGSQIELRQGDAEALPCPDHACDAAVIAFGIRNVVDRPTALAEMARVTRPGGRVVVLELSEPEHGALSAVARLHVRAIVPRLGAWLSGAPEYRYLARSIAAFPPPAEFAKLLASTGLVPIAIERLGFGACHLFVCETRGAA